MVGADAEGAESAAAAKAEIEEEMAALDSKSSRLSVVWRLLRIYLHSLLSGHRSLR